jgi:NAD(P)-dependent dehydrogenase (short-subunit alcohol dehydrogenase family)
MPKRVLITGTSTGFGRDTAERLARRGDHVFATMRDASGRNAAHREALERLASQEGLRLRVLELDVTRSGARSCCRIRPPFKPGSCS